MTLQSVLLLVWFVAFTLDILLVIAAVDHAKTVFRERYPELKPVKKHWSVTFVAIIKLISYAGTPILNLTMLWSFLCHYDEIIDKTIAKEYSERMNEKRKESICSEK